METVIDKSRADPVPQDNNGGGGISPSKVTFCENLVKDEQDEGHKEEVRVKCCDLSLKLQSFYHLFLVLRSMKI